jgi:uncharacterized protein (TIGR03083 family)
VTVAEDAEAERGKLADTLEAVGPSAAAGCGTWTAFDLAGHIVGADRAAGTFTFCIRVVAARGVQFRPKPQVVAYAINRERRGGYPALVARLRRRSPRLLLTPPAAALTLFEVWTHHDDLATANSLDHGAPERLALAIPPLMRYHAALLPSARFVVRTTNGYQWTFGPDGSDLGTVELSGSTANLVRWLAGRAPLSVLDVKGAPAVVDQLNAFTGTI